MQSTVKLGQCQMKGTHGPHIAVPAIQGHKSVRKVRPRHSCHISLAGGAMQKARVETGQIQGGRDPACTIMLTACRATPDVDHPSEVTHQAVVLSCHRLALPCTTAKEGN